ncbi:hypothetical protein Patl1_05112 [Pistacia atlantica]|uniref:Uncharacterized protein n=1 Tax=Pistacia atlantica TaxID=434234 RepID=A0ACC1BPS0_9ROSI|nr:hypothetical protein Patl1_05112 [Pistacia atlantica]
MPQLHTSLHFHLTPIVMINGSSRRDLLLNSQNFCRSIPCEKREPSRRFSAVLAEALGYPYFAAYYYLNCLSGPRI